MQPPKGTELAAEIVDQTRFSVGGVIAVVAMLIVVAVTCTAVAEQDNVIREAAVALIGLVLIVPLSAACVIGRRRTLFVFRQLPGSPVAKG